MISRFALLTLVAMSIGLNAANAAEIALDIGHSLKKPGAISASGRKEFDFNVALGRVVAAELENHGLAVRLIGIDGDRDVLTDRTKQAVGATFFLSLHHDSVQPQYLKEAERFSGYSLFVSRKNPQPEASLACATRIADALLAAGMHPSLHHAEPIPGENRPLADKARGIYWFDDLIVLKTATQPAVLLESGVIVNAREEAWLASPAGRQTIARAVGAAVPECVP
ncbi:N-acetylmuramoyl-L-alanine amidase family protein [Andreprevotia chitinilytica]|uniref:N-acetylmuramoyl-L-alanine amidase family protein n=1 Tax=Andreprevotia chitinilytica TaxID=396808 RepID=UPI00055799F2|nr:N-acetylmuramoyl-L-alanine amidase [Andreprevotia chitinilytica]